MSWHKQRRQQLCKNIFRHFPGRVPVIVEKLDTNIMLLMNKQQQQQNSIRKIFNFNGKKFVNSSSLIDDKTTTTTTTNRKKRFKFLVPYDCSVGQFQWILRNKIDLITTTSSSSNRAIYLIVKRTLPHASSTTATSNLSISGEYISDGYLPKTVERNQKIVINVMACILSIASICASLAPFHLFGPIKRY
ncbi:hypothetical protein DERP_011759 [Dermatophagoides pteronyssinus]|uniref:Uncharacterized protein n=1 Tax=Dermatophagoides pteronyssinus TaxID=6956 RepID=A0ABQ8J3T0_DERPT|nr:hypothetical protein DERP_011759 [Dermatophagoides pteronyssinus]